MKKQGITAKFTPDWDLQLGNKTFPRLKNQTGGYQSIDAQGSQILLNYRFSPSVQAIAPQVTLTQVLNGQVNPNALKNRIILIGVTSNSSSDYWYTPYGKDTSEIIPGITIQAQMVSGIISAALDQRPILWVWSQWGDICWIWGWSLTGGLLAWYLRKIAYVSIAITAASGTLFGLCFILFTQGGWIPLVPPMISLLLSSTIFMFMSKKFQKL